MPPGATPSRWHESWNYLRDRLVGPGGAAALLALALVLDVASTARQIALTNKEDLQASKPPRLSLSLASPRRLTVPTILAAHLFGVADAPKSEVAAEGRLLLTGTLPVPGAPNKGSAILGRTSGATHWLRVGDALERGIELRAVYADHVIIARNGAEESLALPRKLNGLSALQRPAQASNGHDSEETVETPQHFRDLDDLAQRIAVVGGQYSNVFAMHGNFVGELYEGVTVQPGPNAELFKKLGFHPGDVIAGIDGLPLNNPEQLEALSSGQPVRVSVRRPEGDTVITVDLASQ